MNAKLRVGVVGCGLIGRRRAEQAAGHRETECVAVSDVDMNAAATTAQVVGAAPAADWHSLVERTDLDLVVVSTPNRFLCDIAVAALERGKHVLVEKPMGRNVTEAERMRRAACAARRVLKVGFNHRYHPAIAAAHQLVAQGALGEIINVRCRYGHGGRPGYEREWRGSRELAGGGELLDQGVHVVDLMHWFAGVPRDAFALLQTAVWPLQDLEDNAFGLFRFASGAVASLHTSWTQWKNIFSFEVTGRTGAAVVQGLGGSYGVETLTVYHRRPEGGAPQETTQVFEGADESWRLEWDDFVAAVRRGAAGPMLGNMDDGVLAMRLIDALYRSAASGSVVAA